MKLQMVCRYSISVRCKINFLLGDNFKKEKKNALKASTSIDYKLLNIFSSKPSRKVPFERLVLDILCIAISKILNDGSSSNLFLIYSLVMISDYNGFNKFLQNP